MKSEAEAHPVSHAANPHLRIGILSPDPRHVCTTAFRIELVCQLRGSPQALICRGVSIVTIIRARALASGGGTALPI